jgi:hypothetical protein
MRTSRRSVLRRQTEVGERTFAVPVDDEPRDRAVAEVEQVRSFPLHLSKVESACNTPRSAARPSAGVRVASVVELR